MESKKKSIQKKSSEYEVINENQSRRDFFKTVSKIALPTIAFLSFGSLGRELFASNKISLSKAYTDCHKSCTGFCDADCAGGCAQDCEKTCTGNCEGSCESACTGNCEGLNGKSSSKSIYESEETSCDCTGCTGSCLGPCKGDCFSTCSDSCLKNCHNMCQGQSQRTPSACSLRG